MKQFQVKRVAETGMFLDGRAAIEEAVQLFTAEFQRKEYVTFEDVAKIKTEFDISTAGLKEMSVLVEQTEALVNSRGLILDGLRDGGYNPCSMVTPDETAYQRGGTLPVALSISASARLSDRAKQLPGSLTNFKRQIEDAHRIGLIDEEKRKQLLAGLGSATAPVFGMTSSPNLDA